MDNLKSAIADKILEVSSSGRDDMREKLDKINHFCDLINACQVLIEKYPAIETELLRMISKNDFDTKVASIRIDTIVSLSENKSDLGSENVKTTDESISPKATSDEYLAEDSFEDIGYKEVEKSTQEQYIDFDDIEDYTEHSSSTPIPKLDSFHEASIKEESTEYRDPEIKNTTIKPQPGQVKDNAKKGIQVIVVVAAIVILIFAIVFVIQNLETVLWGLGVIFILVFIVWIIFFNKKKSIEDDNSSSEESAEEGNANEED